MTKETTNNKELLHRATIAYYAMDDPILTDDDYDRLFTQEYGDTKTPFELYQSIFSGDGRKRPLDKPMLSLSKARNSAEVNSWLSKMGQEATISLSPKYDGLACLINMSNGEVLSATTRGNGSVGEDVTYAVSHIPGVQELPEGLNQVEVCMSSENMVLLNEKDGTSYAHPRNAAAGVLRLSTSRVKDKASYLSVHRHFDSQAFGVSATVNADDDIEAVMEDYRDTILAKMTETGQSILLDGVVLFAHSNNQLMVELGDDGARPRYAVAWKFPNSAKVANIVDVIWQVGRTKNTPVALFAPPVEFDGVLVARASLHNQDQINRLGVHIGDQVELVRSNEVIPYITKVHRQGENRTPIPAEPDSVTVSTEIQLRHILTVLDVRGAGDTTVNDIAAWIDKNYKLTDDLTSEIISILADMVNKGSSVFSEAVNSFAEKSATTFVNELEKKMKSTDMIHWFATAGIPGLGRRMMKKLFDHYGNANDIIKVLHSKEDITVEGFGSERVNALRNHVDSLSKITSVVTEKVNPSPEFLDASSVDDSDTEEEEEVSVTGTAVITGKIEGWSRKQIEGALSEHGWELGSSVSGSTNVLFNASGRESTKTKSAEKKGVPVVSVETIEDVIEWTTSKH